jgi:hypothetical protein
MYRLSFGEDITPSLFLRPSCIPEKEGVNKKA